MSIWILVVVALIIIVVFGTALLIHGIRRPPRKTFAQVLGRGEPTEPSELGLNAKEVYFLLSDCADTPGWIIEGQNKTGPTLLIIHGFGDSRRGAMLWAPLLCPYAGRIAVFDMPGHGESQAKNCSGGIREPEDILKIIQQLNESTLDSAGQTANEIVLMGYSLGAQVAIATAALAAEKGSAMNITGVIADGPYRFWDEPVKRMLTMRHYPRQPFVFLAWLALYITIPRFRHFDRAAKAAQMQCPLLILHGTDDEICPYQSSQQIAQAARQSTFVGFEGGHHLDLMAIDPKRYQESISYFLTGIHGDR